MRATGQARAQLAAGEMATEFFLTTSNYAIDYPTHLCYITHILAREGRRPETILKAERGLASRAAVRIRAPGGSGEPGPKTARVGAPRGPFRFAPDGRVSQTWCAPLRRARRLRIPPPGAPPAPRFGAGRSGKGYPPTLRRRRPGKRNPGAATRGGNEETALFDIVNRMGRVARSPDEAPQISLRNLRKLDVRNPGSATRHDRPRISLSLMRATKCVHGNALGPGRGRASLHPRASRVARMSEAISGVLAARRDRPA
jgi:hypothetical protein